MDNIKIKNNTNLTNLTNNTNSTNSTNLTKIPTLLCDFYKVSHRQQYPSGTQIIYSTLTPRTNKFAPRIDDTKDPIDYVVSFGFRYFIEKYLIREFNENFFNRPEDEVVEEYASFIKEALGTDDNGEHIRALHRLGFLPLRIKTIEEGTKVAIKVPVMTIENTLPEFFWLTNYFETLISCTTWQPMTSATIASAYREIMENYSNLTCDNHDHIDFQCHDFSMRGMSSLESAILSGMGHLQYFKGTDTIPAILALKEYYGKEGLVGTSIPATEHSVMSSHGLDDTKTFEFLLDLYKEGIFSVVSDTYDFWGVVTKTLPQLKERILNRNGKLVIRPDSGDPVKILCGDPDAESTAESKGLIECLWDIFGGTVNSKGYKVLDPHIGAIYGDSITLTRANKILQHLESKGFASCNVVFGVGSFTYQYNTRDTFGFAVKATHAVINGEQRLIFKDPKTDSGMKKSQRGRVKVTSFDSYVDGLNQGEDEGGLLIEVFKDGKTFY